MGAHTSSDEEDLCNAALALIDSRSICELGRIEYVTCAYVRRHYQTISERPIEFPQQIGHLICEYAKQLNVMKWYNGNAPKDVLNELQDDTAKITYCKNRQLLRLESTGVHNAVISLRTNGIIEYNKYIFYNTDNVKIKHIQINVKGYLYLPKKSGISLYNADDNGGILDITCNTLTMEKGSYIAACGKQYGGKININTKHKLVTKYGICYILANGRECGGEITINHEHPDELIKVNGRKRNKQQQGIVMDLNCIVDCGAFKVRLQYNLLILYFSIYSYNL